MDPATMYALASIVGAGINAVSQSGSDTERIAYTGDASPQGSLSNANAILKALLPNLINRAQTGPDIHDDVMGEMPTINARHFPTSMSLSSAGHESLMRPYAPNTGPGAPQRKSITQIPGLDTGYTGSGSRQPSATATPGGTAMPRPGTVDPGVHANPTAPTRNTVNALPGDPQQAGGIDDRTRGALMLLQHAATMGQPGRRAA